MYIEYIATIDLNFQIKTCCFKIKLHQISNNTMLLMCVYIVIILTQTKKEEIL